MKGKHNARLGMQTEIRLLRKRSLSANKYKLLSGNLTTGS